MKVTEFFKSGYSLPVVMGEYRGHVDESKEKMDKETKLAYVQKHICVKIEYTENGSVVELHFYSQRNDVADKLVAVRESLKSIKKGDKVLACVSRWERDGAGISAFGDSIHKVD